MSNDIFRLHVAENETKPFGLWDTVRTEPQTNTHDEDNNGVLDYSVLKGVLCVQRSEQPCREKVFLSPSTVFLFFFSFMDQTNRSQSQ